MISSIFLTNIQAVLIFICVKHIIMIILVAVLQII